MPKLYIPLHIYTALMPWLHSPQSALREVRKAGQEEKQASCSAASGLKASCHPSVPEGATQTANDIWKRCCGAVKDSLLHLCFQEETFWSISQGPWHFSYLFVGCRRISTLSCWTPFLRLWDEDGEVVFQLSQH